MKPGTQEERGGLCIDSREHRLVETHIRTNKLHKRVLERHLNKTGVYRSQHQLLMYVFRHPEASQKELARLYNVSTAAIAVSLKKLEKGGYIRRLVDEDDNRFNKILITEKGRSVVAESVDFFKKVEARMFAGFSADEEETFYTCVCRIHENLSAMLEEEEREGQKP